MSLASKMPITICVLNERISFCKNWIDMMYSQMYEKTLNDEQNTSDGYAQQIDHAESVNRFKEGLLLFELLKHHIENPETIIATTNLSKLVNDTIGACLEHSKRNLEIMRPQTTFFMSSSESFEEQKQLDNMMMRIKQDIATFRSLLSECYSVWSDRLF